PPRLAWFVTVGHPPQAGRRAIVSWLLVHRPATRPGESTMRWLRPSPSRPGKPVTSGKRRRRPLEIELLETRTVLSPLLVTNTGNQGTGSLRQAIADANARPASDTVKIEFKIPITDKGYNPTTGIFTISLTSSISAITHANVTLDGTSEDTFLNPGP